jgi:hypothetical protein
MIVGVFGCGDSRCNELNCGANLISSIDQFILENPEVDHIISYPNSFFCSEFIKRGAEAGLQTTLVQPFSMQEEIYSKELMEYYSSAADVATNVELSSNPFGYSNVFNAIKRIKSDSDHWVVLSPHDGCCSFTSEILSEAESLKKQVTNLWKVELAD